MDPTPATITAVFAMHTGHIGPSFELLAKTSLAPQSGTYLYLNVGRRFRNLHIGADILGVSFGPSADKDRVAACFHSRYSLALGAHEINLTLNVEMLGVTSVAGFESHPGAGSTWTR